MQKVLCDAYWDELPDSAVVAVFRARTLRNLWHKRAWRNVSPRPQLRIHAWLATVGTLRSQGQPAGVHRKELHYGHTKTRGDSIPQGFDFRSQIGQLRGIPLTRLPELSYLRLLWYASPLNQTIFDVPYWNPVTATQHRLWDQVLKGNFTDLFRADELLVAVRLQDRNPWSPEAIRAAVGPARLSDPSTSMTPLAPVPLAPVPLASLPLASLPLAPLGHVQLCQLWSTSDTGTPTPIGPVRIWTRPHN
ncbi:hypothetical protein GNI_186940 [Gregarina niphandrodes]|uniref:Uncharacterized protein n=1 Tax=Gregarina niphandrodes TaxID=110365 RepID=A0A023AWM7_GRENI|nr:hypothetical protein GNI_186940 [Gregarina niphandrodes]EZG43119.1 hypothetical protein GNI_186940 [Gregarina niphandrodes]|eukprot:XP_011133631.1 hypothetical protein GNI_186940 [Gregarina niphandrodes]